VGDHDCDTDGRDGDRSGAWSDARGVTKQHTETQKEKTRTSIQVEPDVYAAIGKLAEDEDRPSMANMIERLLKTHPRVEEALATAAAGATA